MSNRYIASVPRRSARGFTLIEVMVAIVILSFGLLGVAGLMVLGIQNSYSSQQRTIATQLAYDMIDRMRANFTGVELAASGVGGNYDRPASNPSAAGGPYATQVTACIGESGPATPINACTVAGMVNNDAFEWQDLIRRRLGSGVGIVCRDSSNSIGSYDGTTLIHNCDGVGPKYAIKIYWLDDRSGSGVGTDSVTLARKYPAFMTTFVP